MYRCLMRYFGTYLEKYCFTSLVFQWILCSEWVPSEWEFKQQIKTSQWFIKTPQLIASEDINWWTEVGFWCFHQLFGLSFWFTADYPWVNMWFNATFFQIDDKITSWMARLGELFPKIFIRSDKEIMVGTLHTPVAADATGIHFNV